jgi:hydrogenase-1 operon protein HyaE
VTHPLVEQLFTRHGASLLTPGTIDAFVDAPGLSMLVFTEDPMRVRETPDLAVIVPQIQRAFAGIFRVGVLLPEAARAVQPRYGFRRWPALVVLRNGAYLGAIDGLRTWDEYNTEITHLVEAERAAARPVRIPIASVLRESP